MSGISPTPPSDESCPSWCVADHRPDDFPEDRWHDSTSSYVDVIVKTPDGSRAGEVLVVTSRRFGEFAEWTYIGEPDRAAEGLHISHESARLSSALDRHLRSLTDPPSLSDP